MILPGLIPASSLPTITQLPLDDLLTAAASIDGWRMENLGPSDDPTRDLHGLSLGNPENDTVFMLSGVHGNEWEATHFALEFARFLVNPTAYGATFADVAEIVRRYHFYWIPVGSPWGYVNDSRNNSNDVNINRDYRDLTQPNTQIIAAQVQAHKTVAFLDCHGVVTNLPNSGIGGNYKDPASMFMHREAVRATQVTTGRPVSPYPHYSYSMGHVWAGEQPGNAGGDVLGFLIESYRNDTPDDQVHFGINALHILLRYVDNWVKYRTLNPALGLAG